MKRRPAEKMKPLIGVTAYHNTGEKTLYLRENYLNSVLQAGGLPVLLPQTPDAEILEGYLSHLDALILSGGGDVDPAFYGDTRIPQCGNPDAERDAFELPLAKMALKRGMPVLGICRGCQVLAVVLGAKLIQDIEFEKGIPRISHSQEPPYDRPVHKIFLKPGGLLSEIIPKSMVETNSSHHQAVKAAIPGMHIDAISEDGIIESFSVEGNRNVLGVQFHPEHMTSVSTEAASIFRYLVCQAESYQMSR